MKKTIAFLLAAIMLLSLSACGAPKSISLQYEGDKVKKLEFDLDEDYDREELTLTAVLEPSGAKAEIDWESSDRDVVKLKDNGDGTCTLKLKGVGKAKITAECDGTDLSAKLTIVVNDSSCEAPADVIPAPSEEYTEPAAVPAESAAAEESAYVYSPDVEFMAFDFRADEEVSSELFQCYDVTMINFWEPWCGPCVGEMPELQEIWEEYDTHDMGLLIIGVYGTQDGVAEVLEETGVTYPIICWKECFEKYQTGYVPTTVFFDRFGHAIMLDSADEDGCIFIGSRDKEGWLSIIKQAYESQGLYDPE